MKNCKLRNDILIYAHILNRTAEDVLGTGLLSAEAEVSELEDDDVFVSLLHHDLTAEHVELFDIHLCQREIAVYPGDGGNVLTGSEFFELVLLDTHGKEDTVITVLENALEEALDGKERFGLAVGTRRVVGGVRYLVNRNRTLKLRQRNLYTVTTATGKGKYAHEKAAHGCQEILNLHNPIIYVLTDANITATSERSK